MEAEDQSLLFLDHYELMISEALPRQSFSEYNCGLLVLSLQFLESPEYIPPPRSCRLFAPDLRGF